MRSLTVTTLALIGLFGALAAGAQGSADAPPLAIGTNKTYCHAAEDGMTAWMNTLPDDGDGTTYNVFGEPAFVDPALGIGFDPVQDADFEIRIPLSPSTQDLELAGTITAQAFIGSGAYGGGQGSIGASLAVGGTEVGAAEPQDHTMEPHNSNAGGTGPYEDLTWTFDIPATSVPAGTLLEWVITGHIDFGNNIFLSCFEGRGRSSIDLPVVALSGGPGGGEEDGNSTTNSATDSPTVSGSATNGTSAPTATTGTATNSTTNATGGDSQDSPAPPLAMAALAVLAAASVVRRRLR